VDSLLFSFGLGKILDLYYTGVIKIQALNSSWERISFSGKAIGDNTVHAKTQTINTIIIH